MQGQKYRSVSRKYRDSGASFRPQNWIKYALLAVLAAGVYLSVTANNASMSSDQSDVPRQSALVVDGDLDTSFGTGGKVTTQFSGFDAAYDTVVQPDGKVVVAGRSEYNFVLARYGQNGSLDPTFGTGGVQILTPAGWLAVFGEHGELKTLALQPDGKILFGSAVVDSNHRGFGVFRFNPDGSADSTFGTNGFVFTFFQGGSPEYDAALRDIVVQPDGKIVAVGGETDNGYNDSINHYFLARYNADGTLDQTFGNAGTVIAAFGTLSERGRAVALQPDGKIVVAGGRPYYYAQGDTGGIARYNSNGTLDGTFGGGGHIGNLNCFARDVLVQTDGKIVIAGSSDAMPKKAIVQRWLANGTLDTSFNGGSVLVDPGGVSEFNHISLQSDGKILAAGSRQIATGRDDFIATRINTDGSLDQSFGTGGSIATDFNGLRDDGNGLALQADGRFVIGGLVTGVATGRDVGLARYLSNGSLDASFGTGGKVVTPLSMAITGFNDMALTPDGKIVAGTTYGEAFVLAKYNSDGQLDQTFGVGGKVSVEFDDYLRAVSGSGDYGDLIENQIILRSVKVEPDGKIVAAGSSGNGVNFVNKMFLLARLNPDGSLDTTFNGDGHVAALFNSSEFEETREGLRAMVLQPDGKIAFADYARYFGSDDRTEMRRINANGTGDQWGSSYENSRAYLGINSLMLLPGGNFSAVGQKGWDADNFAIIRYTAAGQLDPNFGNDGVRVTDFGGDQDFALGQALKSDGKITVVGGTISGQDRSIALAQYLDDGSLDTAFGSAGKVITNFGGSTSASSIASVANGKFVVGGVFTQAGGNLDFLVARYNGDGSIDSSFGIGGKVTTDFSGGQDSIYKIAIQNDGKIVAAGYPGIARYLNASGPAVTPTPTPPPTPSASPTPTPLACYPPPPNTVVWYPGDGNTNDLGPGHLNGTITGGVTYVAGEVAQGFNFNGTDGKVAVEDDASLNITGDLTIEGWINPTAISSMAIVSKETDIAHVTYLFSLTPSGRLSFIAGNGSTSSGIISANTFTHVAVTRSGQVISFYINGVLSSSETVATNSIVNTAPLTIGATDNSLLAGFHGIIDEMAIYDRALSAAEIQNIAGAGGFGKCKTGPTPTPIQACNYTQTTTTGQIVPGTVDIGNHSDDGTTAVALPFQFGFYDQSFSSVNVDSNGDLQFNGNTSRFLNFCLPSANFNYAMFPFWDDLRTDANPGCANFPGGLCGIFTSTSGSAPNRIFNIEWRTVGYEAYDVQANFEARLYETTGQIDFVYGSTLFNGSSATVGLQRGTGGSVSQYSCDASAISNGLKITYTVTGCGTPLPTPTPTPSPSATPTPSPTPLCVSMAAWYKFEGDANDAIGGNNGTATGATYEAAKVNQGIHTTTSSLVRVPNSASLRPPSAVSVEGWIKADAAPGIFRGLIGKAEDQFGPSYGLLSDGNGRLVFTVRRAIGSGPYLNSDEAPMSIWDGQFHHVAGTYTSTVIKIYVDGAQFGSSITNNCGSCLISYDTLGDNGDLFMGGTSSAQASNFNGVLDELTIYPRELSAAEIQSIFNAGAAGKCSTAPARTRFDFDGDGRADVAVFRGSDSNWYRLNSGNNSFAAVPWGLSSDVLVPADYDGDGKTDHAIFRSGQWWILQSSNGQVRTLPFGQAGDVPLPGDFDGDGKADIAVFRPSTGTWWRTNSSNGQISATQFGLGTDVPMLGDFDGDGKTDFAVFRPSNGVWYVLRSSDGQVKIDQFGLNGDIALNGDFNGDGKADLAVFRPSDRTWYVARATGVPAQNFDATVFGLSTDVPVPADYDGDGKADIAVYRNGQWWILRSSSGQVVMTPFGISSDVPIETR